MGRRDEGEASLPTPLNRHPRPYGMTIALLKNLLMQEGLPGALEPLDSIHVLHS